MSSPRFTILIDGECPLCVKEGRLLKWLDKGRGRLEVVHFTDAEFDFERYGLTFETAMGQIHGIAPDGTIVTGVEVFRRSYDAVGWGWLWAPTGWPILEPIFDAMYRWFARNRFWLTGRPNPCEGGRCAVPK